MRNQPLKPATSQQKWKLTPFPTNGTEHAIPECGRPRNISVLDCGNLDVFSRLRSPIKCTAVDNMTCVIEDGVCNCNGTKHIYNLLSALCITLMVERLMNDQLETMWKEAVVT